jgi:hypothetical protein
LIAEILKNHLIKKDKEEIWVRTAKKAENIKEYELAYKCFIMALKNNKQNKQLQNSRARIKLLLNDIPKYLNIMKRKVLSGDPDPQYTDDLILFSNICFHFQKKEEWFQFAVHILHSYYTLFQNPKIALHLMVFLNSIPNYSKTITFYQNNHEELCNAKELADDFELLFMIAIVNANALAKNGELIFQEGEQDLFQEQENSFFQKLRQRNKFTEDKFYLELAQTYYHHKQEEACVLIFEYLFSFYETDITQYKTQISSCYPTFIQALSKVI